MALVVHIVSPAISALEELVIPEGETFVQQRLNSCINVQPGMQEMVSSLSLRRRQTRICQEKNSKRRVTDERDSSQSTNVGHETMTRAEASRQCLTDYEPPKKTVAQAVRHLKARRGAGVLFCRRWAGTEEL